MSQNIMKTHLIIFLLFTVFPLIGQEKESKKISIGLSYSPNISYRSISNSENLRDSEQMKYGQSLNIISCYDFNQYIRFETGVSFQSRGFQTPYQELVYSDPSDPALPDKIKFVDRFYYTGIPVKLILKKDFDNVSLISSIGLIGNYLIRQELLTMVDFDGQIEKSINDNSSEFNQFVLTSTIGLGIEWKFKSNYRLFFIPTYQRDLTSVVDSDIKGYLWDFGLNIGLLYRF